MADATTTVGIDADIQKFTAKMDAMGRSMRGSIRQGMTGAGRGAAFHGAGGALIGAAAAAGPAGILGVGAAQMIGQIIASEITGLEDIGGDVQKASVEMSSVAKGLDVMFNQSQGLRSSLEGAEIDISPDSIKEFLKEQTAVLGTELGSAMIRAQSTIGDPQRGDIGFEAGVLASRVDPKFLNQLAEGFALIKKGLDENGTIMDAGTQFLRFTAETSSRNFGEAFNAMRRSLLVMINQQGATTHGILGLQAFMQAQGSDPQGRIAGTALINLTSEMQDFLPALLGLDPNASMEVMLRAILEQGGERTEIMFAALRELFRKFGRGQMRGAIQELLSEEGALAALAKGQRIGGEAGDTIEEFLERTSKDVSVQAAEMTRAVKAIEQAALIDEATGLELKELKDVIELRRKAGQITGFEETVFGGMRRFGQFVGTKEFGMLEELTDAMEQARAEGDEKNFQKFRALQQLRIRNLILSGKNTFMGAENYRSGIEGVGPRYIDYISGERTFELLGWNIEEMRKAGL